MKKENRPVLRIIALILAITLLACGLSSCGGKTNEEEITRGTEQIEKPSEEETTQEETTTAENGETSTDVLSGLAGLKVTTTAASSDNVTFANQAENEAINNAASSSGVSAAGLAAFVMAMGFDYDATQGIFYTNLDNWQRQANYVGHYDTFAQFGNMRYRTAKMDFGTYDGLDWRIQIWKGQYGAFGGSEIGIYTKNPDTNEMLYNCADNDHLIYMESALYLTPADYTNGNVYFTREWQAHWWLTGFKAGVVDPSTLVMKMRIRMRSSEMSKMFEQALIATGFTKGDATTQYDTYRRQLNDFYILWYQVGEMNYQAQQ